MAAHLVIYTMFTLIVILSILQYAVASRDYNCTLFTERDSFPRIMVTGGAGFIGSSLVKKLKEMKYSSVKVADNFWRGKYANLVDQKTGSYVVNEADDICVVDLTVAIPTFHVLRNVDWVIHLADAVAGISFVFDHQSWLFRENILINTNVLNSATHHKVLKYIYVGTACSYPLEVQETGTTGNPAALNEDQVYPAHPESSYGWSKLMGEYELSLMNSLNVSILRLHNVYGHGGDYADQTKSQAIPSIIRKAINYPTEKFSIWGDGLQYRDFVHVDDVVRALVLTMQKNSFSGVIQIGTSVATNLHDAATYVAALTDRCLLKKLEMTFDTSMRNGDQGRIAIIKKARKILSWTPAVSIFQGISMNYAWILRDMAAKTGDSKLKVQFLDQALCLDKEAELEKNKLWVPPVRQAKGFKLVIERPKGDLTDVLLSFYCENDRQTILNDLINFKPPRKTLVVVLSSTRAGHLTYENFNVNVLDLLNADLALAVESQSFKEADSFRNRAKYVWEMNPPKDNDYIHFYNQIATQCFNHTFNESYATIMGTVGGQSSGWLGCIKACKQPACSGQIIFYRWFALQNIIREKLYLLYDTVVVTRSDFLWVAPHANTFIPAETGKIFVPVGIDSWGLSDRHYFLSMTDARRTLGLADLVVQRESAEAQKEFLFANGFRKAANLEVVNLLWHREMNNLTIVRYPHSGMLVRDAGETDALNSLQRWSVGDVRNVKGQYFVVKYREEYQILVNQKLI